MPTWIIVLIVLGVAGFIGIFAIGMLAAIAIPNFVKARQTAQTNACINQLRSIQAAKNQWALENKKKQTEIPKEIEVTPHLKAGGLPTCPAGGNYMINAVDENPTCSVPKHQLPFGPEFHPPLSP